MSFLNTIRGLGRSSKKTKKDIDPSSPLYSIPNSSSGSLRNPHSPNKGSPSKQRSSQIQQSQSQQSQQQQLSQSPTRRNHRTSQSSNRSSPQRQHYQQHHHHHHQQQDNDEIVDEDEIPLFLCDPFVKTALVKGSFKTIVQLPKYVDVGEWLALNIFELFNNLNQFYGVISEYVTPEAYPTMNAGPHTNYLWVDGNGQTVNLPASHYIEYVITWISSKINDQSVFPTKSGGAFPPNFLKDCKNISRQMFRIFAHIYYQHFDKIVHLSLEAHWNSFFAHFISFVKEFNLIAKNELTPLLPLLENLEQQGKIA
ncbi:putative transcription effector of cell separation genes in the daughter cell [Scheffersomyces amazonensis]|uniref:putative transcription effector of cell separation genes in the daughter cell n=1 Tax=Scheffersomyces amazonensis TaxID=1078765 RepID=UPI00315DA578